MSLMKKNIIITSVLFIIIIALYFFIIPIIHENNCKKRIYNDLIDKASTAEKSVIGIISKSDMNKLASFSGIGSGVIFEKKGNTYYAVTAAHVVDNKDCSYLVFTRNTEFKGQTVLIDEKKSAVFEIPDDEYYKSLINGNVEYISESDDLAIISFETEEDLPILEFENNKIQKGNRIISIGHPEGERYIKTYGKITSELKPVNLPSKTSKDKIDRVIEHNCYLNFGNSGGVAISENMKIEGINIGGQFTLTKKYSKAYMIPYNIVKENIDKWQAEK